MTGASPFARVAVGSANPVKIAAVAAVLARVAPACAVQGVSVPSGVADQPMGDEATISGARTRAHGALGAVRATLAIGLEGGCVELPDGTMRTCAWAVAIDTHGREGVGGSLVMPLPPAVAALVRSGVELGHAMDQVAKAHNTKHGVGAVGILTAGLLDRQRAYETLVTYALAPWLASAYWAKG